MFSYYFYIKIDLFKILMLFLIRLNLYTNWAKGKVGEEEHFPGKEGKRQKGVGRQGGARGLTSTIFSVGSPE